MVQSDKVKVDKKRTMSKKKDESVKEAKDEQQVKRKVAKKSIKKQKNTSAAFLKLKDRIRRVQKAKDGVKNDADDGKNMIEEDDDDFVDIKPLDDDESGAKHQNLIQSIKSIKSRPSKDAKIQIEIRREPNNQVSELNLTNRYDDADEDANQDAGRRLNLSDLISAAKDVSGVIDKSVKRLKKKKVVTKPLNEVQSSLIERQVNHELALKKVSKWQPIVDAHSSAPQLIFPLDTPSLHMETSEEVASRYQKGSRNEMESKIDALLSSSKNYLSDDKILTPAEEEYLKSLSLEEAQERHSQLQKMRALLSYKEAKLRRQKKIKSRNFHRILKKDKLKDAVKEFETLKETDPERALEKLNELDKIRALERVTLRHKTTGRWALRQKLRSKYDDEARANIAKQVEKSNDLLKKRKLESDDDEEEDKYQDAKDHQDAEDDDEDADDDNNLLLDNNFNPWMKTQKKELEEKIRKNQASDPKDDDKDKDDAKQKKTPIVTKDVKSSYYQRLQDLTDSESEDEGDAEQAKLISEAFADDDVVVEFDKDKDAVVSEETPKDIDNFLPGWGSWTGPGVDQDSEKMKQKRDKFTIKVKKPKRKDSNLGNVIVSEKVNASIERLQVKQLPREFKSVPEFESLISAPIGRTWNTQLSFQSLTEPSVITKMGTIIKPMDTDSLAPFDSKKSYKRMKKMRKNQ